MAAIIVGMTEFRKRPRAMAQDPLADALERLKALIERAHVSEEPDANAATLATVDASSGRPSVRTIYVHLVTDGLAFFINEKSGKGQQLIWNPQAAFCFFWRRLQQQVTLEGAVERMNDDEADEVWAMRPRESRLASRASQQQALEGDKEGLDARLHEERQRFSFAQVARPEHWVGYRMTPDRIEFWDTGWHRMRVRHLIERGVDGRWEIHNQEP